MDMTGLWDESAALELAGDELGSPQFACQSGDFLATDGDSLLGSFDGRDARDLHAYAVDPGDAQLLVSVHELLHHDLQWSTGWGLIGAMAGLLATSDSDPDRLKSVANYANRQAKHVHEIFATTISAGVLGIPRGRELMAGNRQYLRYLDQGLSLGGDLQRWPWQFRESAIQMLLRSLMQPRGLLDLAEAGFERLTAADLTSVSPPDMRLRRTRTAGGWWDSTFTELLAQHPDRGGDTGGPWARNLPNEQVAMETLRAYEETVLIPQLSETARERLRQLGIDCLDEQEYLHVAESLRISFQELAPAEWEVELLTQRRPWSHEPLGAERERIQLHPTPAVADIVSPDELGDSRFVLRGPGDQSTILAIYLPGAAYAVQFGVQGLAAVPAVLALAGWPRLDAEDTRHVPLALFTPDLTPADLQAAFPGLRVIILTTLTTTRNQPFRDHILGLPQAFVLIDLPLSLQISYWINDGWTIRFATIDLNSPYGLTLLLFALDELPGICFLSYRSNAGFGEVAQLLDRHPGKVTSDLLPSADLLRDITTLSSWLLSSWWRFQEAENL